MEMSRVSIEKPDMIFMTHAYILPGFLLVFLHSHYYKVIYFPALNASDIIVTTLSWHPPHPVEQ